MAEKNVGGIDRLGRTLFAVVLTLVVVSTLQKRKRKTGLLALVGALGFNATTRFCGLNKTLNIGTTDEQGSWFFCQWKKRSYASLTNCSAAIFVPGSSNSDIECWSKVLRRTCTCSIVFLASDRSR